MHIFPKNSVFLGWRAFFPAELILAQILVGWRQAGNAEILSQVYFLIGGFWGQTLDAGGGDMRSAICIFRIFLGVLHFFGRNSKQLQGNAEKMRRMCGNGQMCCGKNLKTLGICAKCTKIFEFHFGPILGHFFCQVRAILGHSEPVGHL